jgi:hypothetical protein
MAEARAPSVVVAEHEEDRRRVVCAVELGWRISYLYADLSCPLHDAPCAPTAPPCLPAVETLPNRDQLELHFRAAGSLAARLRLDDHAGHMAALAIPAREAAERPQQRERVLAALRTYHHALIKELWATREGEGKAYELGSSLFDTWNRLRLASARGQEHVLAEWPAVFDGARIERIKELLDDLQTRLDPAAVTVVKDHLDSWRDRVEAAVETDPATLPDGAEMLEAMRSQALIWRQLVTRDKEPEAYLQREDRTKVRHEFNRLMWLSLRRPLPIACAVAFAALLAVIVVGDDRITSPAKALLPILGAVGLTQASLFVVARERLRVWSELLWNRALAEVVFEVTCLVDDVFPMRRRCAPRLARSAKAAARARVAAAAPQAAADVLVAVGALQAAAAAGFPAGSPPAVAAEAVPAGSPLAARSPIGSAAEL